MLKRNGFKKEDVIRPKPFVRWVGGKRGILNEILPRLPKKINHYYEPFVGGGALFFELYDKCCFSHLSDLNADLIVAYSVIKNNVKKLIEKTKVYIENHSIDYYYKVRACQETEDPLENSARFIYLMMTCFNGLYRVNKDSCFNTSIGARGSVVFDEENLLIVSDALQFANIKYQDFSKIIPDKGDFVYFDPPYHPIASDSFVMYVCNGFSTLDQVRLRDLALSLSKRGINVMLSNSYADFVVDLYKNDFDIVKIVAPRFIGCKKEKKQPVYEVIIKNY